MSSFLRLQSQISKNMALKPIIPKKIPLIRRKTDFFFVLSFIVLTILLGIIFIPYKQAIRGMTESILLFFSVVIGVLFIVWEYFKYTFPTEDKFSKLHKLSLKRAVPAGLIAGVLILSIWLNIFSSYIPNQVVEQFSFPLYAFTVLLVTSCIVVDLFRTASPKTQDILYIHKFLVQKFQQWDPKYSSVYTNFLALLGIILIIPLLLIYFVTQNIELTIFIWFSVIGLLYVGYWSGYSLYRSFRWLQGYNTDIHVPLIKQIGLTNVISIMVAIGSILWLIVYGIIILLVQNNFLQLNNFADLIVGSITMIILIATSLQSSTRVTNTQPNYSVLFSLFQLSTITLLSTVLFKLLGSTITASWLSNLFNNYNNINLLLIICYWGALFLLFRTNSNHVRVLIYKDDFESGQLISEINLALNQLKSIHLTLLAKIGRYHSNTNTKLKLLGVYEYIFENNSIDDVVLETMQPFLLYELENANDWRTHAVCFDLIDHFLQVKPQSYRVFYDKSLLTIKHKNEMVRQASLNLLGQIVNINPSLADEVFPLIFDVFETADEQFKKNDIEPMKYYAKHFPQYRERLYIFITNRVEKELFGVSTELMKVLQEIALVDDGIRPRIITFCEETLTIPESRAGLGAIRILLDHFPMNPQEGVPVIKLLISSLHIAGAEVKAHIIYALGTIFTQVPELIPLLREIDFAMDDEDANVRSALLQIVSELYPHGSIPQDVLLSYIKIGSMDADYVVRLMTIQAVEQLVMQEPKLFVILPEILEKLLDDTNTDVKETALKVYEKNYSKLKENFPQFVDKIAIDIDRDQIEHQNTKIRPKIIFKENAVAKPEYD